jgi:hypothetical protein
MIPRVIDELEPRSVLLCVKHHVTWSNDRFRQFSPYDKKQKNNNNNAGPGSGSGRIVGGVEFH